LLKSFTFTGMTLFLTINDICVKRTVSVKQKFTEHQQDLVFYILD